MVRTDECDEPLVFPTYECGGLVVKRSQYHVTQSDFNELRRSGVHVVDKDEPEASNFPLPIVEGSIAEVAEYQEVVDESIPKVAIKNQDVIVDSIEWGFSVDHWRQSVHNVCQKLYMR